MSEYRFTVLDVVAEPYAVSPQLTARLRIDETTGLRVHAVVLRCQVRIEPQRRRYDEAEANGLLGLFDGPERWGDTLKPFLWMQCNTTVQGFVGRTETDLALPCTYDLEVTGTRYLHALGGGEIPLALLFSGTVFTRGRTGFGVEQIPWSCEATYRLPVGVWRDMIAAYYPDSGWLRVGSEILDQLAGYRARHGLTGWDETMRRLLSSGGVP